MKLLVLSGSYRKNGNTDRILELIAGRMALEAARLGEPLEIETAHLRDLDLGPCLGCRACFDRGEERCPQEDGLPALKARMLAADALLVGGPVYVNDVSGAVKNWMDRLAHVCHRPEFFGKYAALVATVGSGPTGHALRTLDMGLSSWGYRVSSKAGFKMGARAESAEIAPRFTGSADRMARRLLADYRARRSADPSIVSLLYFAVQQRYWRRETGDSVDLRYWRDQGWLEPGAKYYIPMQASPLKVAAGRLLGKLIAPFVT